MADPAAEARIRDLRRRLELEPGSRLFLALAEELRKSGRLAEALSTLQEGLLAHPNYLSAQVALGRAYLEVGQITEAIATFSKVLAADPGNLVSSKSLGDIYLSRGESVEAVKKYKLYRALSGDRNVEEIIRRLEEDLAPPPPPPSVSRPPVSTPPPSPSFAGGGSGATPARARETTGKQIPPGGPALSFSALDLEKERRVPPPSDAEPYPAPHEAASPGAASLEPSPLEPSPSEPPPPTEGPATTRAIRTSDFLGPAPRAGEEAPPVDREAFPVQPQPAAPAEPQPAAPAGPQGRTLADLYFAQGHYTEALAIYEDLLAADPFDPELRRLRRDAEARLLPAGSTPGMALPDRALERRLAKIRALKQWLSVIQAR